MNRYSDPLSICVVGDIMPGISSIKSLATENTVPNRIRSGPVTVFKQVQSALTEGNLLLGTLECPLTNSFPYDKLGDTPFLLGPEQSAESLTSVDFDCVSLATNHMLDHGEQAVETTLNILRGSGLDYVGDPFEECMKRTYEVKDRTIAVGGFNICDQGRQNEKEDLFKFIDQTDEADLTLLLVHWGWGFEHLATPAESQVELGHSLIDAGADLVLGSHSHVFQQVEQYKGGIIAYSLGNFLFDMWRPENQETGILKIIHDKTGSFNVSITPVKIVNGLVSQSNHNLDDLIITSPPDIPTNVNILAKIKNWNHMIQIAKHYIQYSNRLPREYHVSNMKRWGEKLSAPREVFR